MPTYNQDCDKKEILIIHKLFFTVYSIPRNYVRMREPLLEVRKIWRRTFMICDYETSYILLVSQ